MASMAMMAGIRAILLSVCTEELVDYEYECEIYSDRVEEFLPFFLLEDKLQNRERTVRIPVSYTHLTLPTKLEV